MAGAGYDISASRSDANSQAANQQAGTVINFGAGADVTGGWYGGQDAAPNATAVAARNAGAVDTSIPQSGKRTFADAAANVDWKMVAIAGLAILAVGAAIYVQTRKAG